jgi:hypothetical protein
MENVKVYIASYFLPDKDSSVYIYDPSAITANKDTYDYEIEMCNTTLVYVVPEDAMNEEYGVKFSFWVF